MYASMYVCTLSTTFTRYENYYIFHSEGRTKFTQRERREGGRHIFIHTCSALGCENVPPPIIVLPLPLGRGQVGHFPLGLRVKRGEMNLNSVTKGTKM